MMRWRDTHGFNRRAMALAMVIAAILATNALAMSELGAPSAARAEPANFVEWRPGLSSSAQPSAMYLARVKALDYAVVINLAPPQSHGSIASEGAIVNGQGVRYVNLPVDFNRPTAEDFRRFEDEMQRHAGASVLVHCQVNMRASAFVFLYRVIHEGAPVEEAASKLTGVWIPDRVWKKFIDDTLAAHGKKADIF
jgi:protein tyrosine phosphatase (PTP) superfamily phosphohydrolase (DUF442 family)